METFTTEHPTAYVKVTEITSDGYTHYDLYCYDSFVRADFMETSIFTSYVTTGAISVVEGGKCDAECHQAKEVKLMAEVAKSIRAPKGWKKKVVPGEPTRADNGMWSKRPNSGAVWLPKPTMISFYPADIDTINEHPEYQDLESYDVELNASGKTKLKITDEYGYLFPEAGGLAPEMDDEATCRKYLLALHAKLLAEANQ